MSLGDFRVIRNIRQNGRLKEAPNLRFTARPMTRCAFPFPARRRYAPRLSPRLFINQRPDSDVGLQAVVDRASYIYRPIEFFRKTMSCKRRPEHVTWLAHTGLPGVAKLRSQRAFDGFIQIGIKDDVNGSSALPPNLFNNF